MYFYRELKKESLSLCLKLSIPLILGSLFVGGVYFPMMSASYPTSFVIFFVLIAPGLFGLGRMVYALFGGYQSRVREYIADAPDPLETTNQFQQAYANADRCFNRICIAGPWALIQDGPATHLYELQEILWVYQFVHTIRRGLSSSSTYHLTVCDTNGDRTRFEMPKRDVEQSLEAFGAYAPFIVRGYNEQLSSLYKSDRAKFSRAVRQRQQEAEAKRNSNIS